MKLPLKKCLKYFLSKLANKRKSPNINRTKKLSYLSKKSENKYHYHYTVAHDCSREKSMTALCICLSILNIP